MHKGGYRSFDGEIAGGGNNVLSIWRITQHAVRVFKVARIGPLFGHLCERDGPGEGFGVMLYADGVVRLEKGGDLGGGAAKGCRIAEVVRATVGDEVVM